MSEQSLRAEQQKSMIHSAHKPKEDVMSQINRAKRIIVRRTETMLMNISLRLFGLSHQQVGLMVRYRLFPNSFGPVEQVESGDYWCVRHQCNAYECDCVWMADRVERWSKHSRKSSAMFSL